MDEYQEALSAQEPRQSWVSAISQGLVLYTDPVPLEAKDVVKLRLGVTA